MRQFLLPALLLASLTGCDILDFADSQRFTEDFHHSYPLKPGGRLTVDNQNGSIEIVGWSDTSVEITGQKFANSEEVLKAIKIDVSATPDSITIRTVRPEGRHGNSGAKYSIRVPRSTRLDRIVSSNGHLRAEDVDADADMKTSNGSIRVYRLRGSLEAITSNGSIDLNEVDGGAEVQTTNGRIHAEAVTGGLQASTTNGGIGVELLKPEPNRPVRLSTTNGSVDVRFNEVARNDVRASTTNGSITVRMPADSNARVEARTSRSSSISTEFDVSRSGSDDKHRLEGTIGKGGPLLDLSTTNGAIRLLKL